MNTIAALKIIEAGIITATNALITMQRYNDLIITAREAGREITDEELKALMAEGHALFDSLKGSLDDAG